MSELNERIKTVTTKIQGRLENASQVVLAKVNEFFQKPSISLEELASFISSHPDTGCETKEFLGFQYSFYQLNIEDLTFYLETKGQQGEYILDLTVSDQLKTLFEYHSFDKKHAQDTKLHIPDAIKTIVH
ncbi:hypothetical protein [Fredinandcohnia quinoae]|uniref:Uncharacterized protein n=1 Tax=Fredinandcohnia quinoae TaxID=2918902 RepID=A0AAW5EB44_9BACI|nr:hypothetical protein [Fredinandcohnia sp. SECRCQ15]MCH1627082.1 hypothetical protein [Fredinandcohnia sp. SECRCQ15]